MKTLYIFPHPDDETFGPAPLIYRQTTNKEEVHLLTLTKGGATKMRFKYGLTVKEMGDVRYQEMLKMQEVLGITTMTVLDYEDGGMAHIDPRVFEKQILKVIDRIQPNIIITYPIHGISGHHDHLVCHAIVKRLFCQLRDDKQYHFLQRLAFLTIPSPNPDEKLGGHANVKFTHPKYIDCIIKLQDKEIQKLKEALACYDSYQQVVVEDRVVERVGSQIHFEFFEENFVEPVSAIDFGIHQTKPQNSLTDV